MLQLDSNKPLFTILSRTKKLNSFEYIKTVREFNVESAGRRQFYYDRNQSNSMSQLIYRSFCLINHHTARCTSSSISENASLRVLKDTKINCFGAFGIKRQQCDKLFPFQTSEGFQIDEEFNLNLFAALKLDIVWKCSEKP